MSCRARVEQGQLAKWLVDNSCADRVFFCNSGAEANEAAMKVIHFRSFFFLSVSTLVQGWMEVSTSARFRDGMVGFLMQVPPVTLILAFCVTV